MNIFQRTRNLLKSPRNNFRKVSYSQCGEDIIVNFIISSLGISKPTYLDIGAYHPEALNNTYFFYLKGYSGVLIEPDPQNYSILKKKRKKDIVLNVGIGIDDKLMADFFIMSSKTLNTFSKEDAERLLLYGNQKIEQVLKIPLKNINSIIKEYFQVCPNFVSLDVEGLDYEILKSFDFLKFRPQVFCIETLTYTEDNTERKLCEIIELMKEQDYLPYADTYINTIFVEAKAWKNR